MNYQIINSEEALAQVCQLAREAQVAMLDTEFVRTRTYYPQLGLIQLFDGQQLSLIDPLAITDMTPFVHLLNDRSVIKVLHACGEDLEVFYNAFQCTPEPMLDTQLMAAFLGHGLSTGFASLVSEYLHVDLDKSESRTDWLARPLSTKQLEYAAADVHYLLPLFDILRTKVNEADWLQAVEEESALLINKRIKSCDPDTLYTDIKGAWQLKPKELAILQPLARWRYQEAVRRDLALNFVFKEADLLLVAKQGLTSVAALIQAGVDERAAKRHGAKICAIVKQAQQTDPDDYPPVIERLMDKPGYKQLFKDLKDEVKAASARSGLATEFVASKKQINQFITWVWQSRRDPDSLPDVMQSWRKPLVGEKLNQLIG